MKYVETKYNCGEIYRDEKGKISHGHDSIYVLISRDFEEEIYNCYVWKTIRMSVCFDDEGKQRKWMGGQIVKLYDSDIDMLKYEDVLPFKRIKKDKSLIGSALG